MEPNENEKKTNQDVGNGKMGRFAFAAFINNANPFVNWFTHLKNETILNVCASLNAQQKIYLRMKMLRRKLKEDRANGAISSAQDVT